jgi:hypothetical protein
MKSVSLFLASCLLTLAGQASFAGEATEKRKADSNQGMTFEDIGRGLKSAAKNIGDEIPKIGPAIADTFRKVSGSEKSSGSDNTSTKPDQKSGPVTEKKKQSSDVR